jgi:hypothetical protein
MRVIVFATDLRKVIAGLSPGPGVRCGGSGDREQLIAAGADARWLDSGMSNGSTSSSQKKRGK